MLLRTTVVEWLGCLIAMLPGSFPGPETTKKIQQSFLPQRKGTPFEVFFKLEIFKKKISTYFRVYLNLSYPLNDTNINMRKNLLTMNGKMVEDHDIFY